MASIQPLGARWRVQLYVDGKRESASFDTKREAAAWALSREAELSGKKLPDKTLGDAMKRYTAEVAPGHRGEKWERVRLTALQRYPLARRKLANLAGKDLADWRDARLGKVKPATVAREMTLLRSVLEVARRDWQWIRVNPIEDVRWPTVPKGRARRIEPDEVDAVVKAFGVADKLRADTATQRVGLAFLFALETAMRSGEIVEILKALPEGDGPVFGLDGPMRDALWRKTKPAEIPDLHFHDTRGEAIWRLSKKLDVLQLARMIGHRDVNSLMIYYRESAADLAKRLD
jgi:integrase